jgi:hypothetical protein
LFLLLDLHSLTPSLIDCFKDQSLFSDLSSWNVLDPGICSKGHDTARARIESMSFEYKFGDPSYADSQKIGRNNRRCDIKSSTQ